MAYLMHIRGNVSPNELEMVIYAAKEIEPQFFVPSGKTKKSEINYVYSQSKAIVDKYFYQSSNKNEDFGKDFLVYDSTMNEYQSAFNMTKGELLEYISFEKEVYISKYRMCYGNISDEVINSEYNKFIVKQQKYVQALYNTLH